MEAPLNPENTIAPEHLALVPGKSAPANPSPSDDKVTTIVEVFSGKVKVVPAEEDPFLKAYFEEKRRRPSFVTWAVTSIC